MGLLEQFSGRIEIAYLFLLAVRTTYSFPLISRPTAHRRKTGTTRFSQSSPFPFRILEIIIIIILARGKPRKWRSDDVFYCAQE